jgi:hypothetical protein
MEFEKGELEYYIVAMIGASIIGIASEYDWGFIAFCGLTITVIVCLYIGLTKFPRKDK